MQSSIDVTNQIIYEKDIQEFKKDFAEYLNGYFQKNSDICLTIKRSNIFSIFELNFYKPHSVDKLVKYVQENVGSEVALQWFDIMSTKEKFIDFYTHFFPFMIPINYFSKYYEQVRNIYPEHCYKFSYEHFGDFKQHFVISVLRSYKNKF